MNLWQIPFVGWGLIIIGFVVGIAWHWIAGALMMIGGISILLYPYGEEDDA